MIVRELIKQLLDEDMDSVVVIESDSPTTVLLDGIITHFKYPNWVSLVPSMSLTTTMEEK